MVYSRFLHRSLRDDQPQTPPGPEGSNGSGEVGRRSVAGAGLCLVWLGLCLRFPLFFYLPMSYQVLARKWRPAGFDEVVGQEHVLRAMINALNQQRLHHAYLFTGTRGVGKTTLARILAKCLNCETGVSATPCGHCDACKEISEGRFVDLIEVDAASRTRVDDTRELLENVQYAPTRGRFKVYLIDEVHMLSTHSFNALLKTLEEPPPHVKFLLATTDPQKLPVTVLSRCLQFNLKRVSEAQIVAQLAHILEQEQVTFETPALHHLAHAADGSLRDALSLLDQAIAYGEGAVRDQEVGQMLGSVSTQSLIALMSALIEGDATELMQQVAQLAELAPDYDHIFAAMITLLHDLAMAQMLPDALSLRGLDVQALSPIASRASPEELQLFYEIALRARRDLPLVPEPRYALEMALLRMLAFKPADAATPPRSIKAPSTPIGSGSATRESTAKPPIPNDPEATTQPERGALAAAKNVTETTAVKTAPDHDQTADPWESILDQLAVTGMTKMFASHCILMEHTQNVLTLGLSARHEGLQNATVTRKLEKALQTFFDNTDLKLRVELQAAEPDSPAARQKRAAEERQLAAEAAIASDPIVDALKTEFGAEIIPGSIKPE